MRYSAASSAPVRRLPVAGNAAGGQASGWHGKMLRLMLGLIPVPLERIPGWYMLCICCGVRCNLAVLHGLQHAHRTVVPCTCLATAMSCVIHHLMVLICSVPTGSVPRQHCNAAN